MGERTCSLRASLLVAALSAVSLLVFTTMVLSVLMASGALQGLNWCPACGASAGEWSARLVWDRGEVVREREKSVFVVVFRSHEGRSSSRKGFIICSQCSVACPGPAGVNVTLWLH